MGRRRGLGVKEKVLADRQRVPNLPTWKALCLAVSHEMSQNLVLSQALYKFVNSLSKDYHFSKFNPSGIMLDCL